MTLVSSGFIFPDTTILETAGIGHCKCADKYIKKHGLQRYFEGYKGESDEFLVERLGAIKVGCRNGVYYLYMSRWKSWYTSKMRDVYENKGYKIVYFKADLIVEETKVIDYGDISYNTTVVRDVDSEGNLIYKYNPLRDGD